MDRLDKRIDELIEAARQGLEQRVPQDKYHSLCGEIEAYRAIRAVCVELEKDEL